MNSDVLARKIIRDFEANKENYGWLSSNERKEVILRVLHYLNNDEGVIYCLTNETNVIVKNIVMMLLNIAEDDLFLMFYKELQRINGFKETLETLWDIKRRIIILKIQEKRRQRQRNFMMDGVVEKAYSNNESKKEKIKPNIMPLFAKHLEDQETMTRKELSAIATKQEKSIVTIALEESRLYIKKRFYLIALQCVKNERIQNALVEKLEDLLEAK